jgi:hypothetical protein
MNPWSRYISSLIHIPGPGEPPARAVLFDRGKRYERILFESNRPDARSAEPRCAGCGARHMELHVGYCSEERCPACGGHLTICGCFPERMPPWTRPILIH